VTEATQSTPTRAARRIEALGAGIQIAASLFKLRIVSLLLMAAFGGAMLGAQGGLSSRTAMVLLLTGGISAAGASALNQYFERHSDRRMRRTRRRPLVQGEIRRPVFVLILGGAMVMLPALAVLPWNPGLAFFLLLGAGIYVGVYTLWLKPRTAMNIVLGGGAGSAAVLSGGAAVGAWSHPAVLALALLVFLWTPSHFWSFSLLYRRDYQRSRYPMLPAQASPAGAARWILVHTLAAVLTGLTLWVAGNLGGSYLAVASASGAWYIAQNLRLIRSPDPAQARRLFLTSNFYLFLILMGIYADRLLAWV
jgi:protoheme IX farnesyltransferase